MQNKVQLHEILSECMELKRQWQEKLNIIEALGLRQEPFVYT